MRLSHLTVTKDGHVSSTSSRGGSENRYIDMMRIAQHTDVLDDHVVIVLSGDLDLSAVARVRSVFHEVLRDGWNRVVVDLSEVGFIDSAGLGVLIGLQRRCRENAGVCALLNPSTDASRLISTSGLAALLPSVDSLEGAITITQPALSNVDADGVVVR